MADRPHIATVITGVGVVSPIGVGVDAFWKSLVEGRSGVSAFSTLENTPMPVRFGGAIDDFEPKHHVKPRKSLKVMCREIQMAFASAGLALQEAGVESATVDPDRFGVVFGSDMLYCEYGELEEVYRNCLADGSFEGSRWGDHAMSDLNPLWMLKYLPNMPACHIGIAHDARAHNNSISLGDASSLMAISEAARVIQRGHAEVMIAGGTGSRLSITPMLYRGDSNLSHRDDSPAAASRPFDAERDGMVNGEGSGCLILESRAHAESRGARILAEVVGSAIAHEARPIGTRETGEATRNSIQRALEEAGVGVEEVDHVNARGISTVEEDASEAKGIREVVGDAPVTALKSYFGALGAGSGAVELAASALALDRGLVPATLNFVTPDPRCPVNVIRESKDVTGSIAVAVNQAGTGQAAAVVLRKP